MPKKQKVKAPKVAEKPAEKKLPDFLEAYKKQNPEKFAQKLANGEFDNI